jgi:hypothetical protein
MTEPGEKCPECQRRVPHPKKPNSPESKVVSYRVPLDDAETHNEVATVVAELVGLDGAKYWRWALHNYAYAVLLQGARLEDTGG